MLSREEADGLLATYYVRCFPFRKHLFRAGEIAFKRRSPLMQRRTNSRQDLHRGDVVKIPRL